jgi:hypothetical protein
MQVTMKSVTTVKAVVQQHNTSRIPARVGRLVRIKWMVLPLFQIVSNFGFSRYTTFVMHLDILYA